jgi:hypothetical protein
MIFDELWRAQRKRKKLSRALNKLGSEFERERSSFDPEDPGALTKADEDLWKDKYQAPIGLLAFNFRKAEDEINAIETRRVQERAEKFGIPIGRDSWMPGFERNSRRLRPEARITISEQIRKERRARMEDRMLWANHLGPLLSPLTGFLGVLIAFIALLHSCE